MTRILQRFLYFNLLSGNFRNYRNMVFFFFNFIIFNIMICPVIICIIHFLLLCGIDTSLITSTSEIPFSQTKTTSLCCCKVSRFKPVIVKRKYGCNLNLKIITFFFLLSCVEDYWLTSIIYHNKLPLFHYFHASCSLTIGRLAHHSKLLHTFYKKLITILQKYSLDNLPCNCYNN